MHWTLQNVVWISSFVLEISLASILVFRRLWQTYPVFCTYVLCEVLRTAVLLTIGNGPRHYATYFYAFWISEGVVSIIGFAVVAEIFRNAFSAKLGLQKWGTILFRCSLMGLLVAALLTARSVSIGDADKLLALIFLLKRIESFVRLGIVAALFVFVFVLGLPWTQPIVGIAAGFAIYGAVEVVATGVRAGSGPIANKTHIWTIMIVDLLQKTLWVAYFFPWQRPPSELSATALPDPAVELDKMHHATQVLVKR
jgi:hypothetical protein